MWLSNLSYRPTCGTTGMVILLNTKIFMLNVAIIRNKGLQNIHRSKTFAHQYFNGHYPDNDCLNVWDEILLKDIGS